MVQLQLSITDGGGVLDPIRTFNETLANAHTTKVVVVTVLFLYIRTHIYTGI